MLSQFYSIKQIIKTKSMSQQMVTIDILEIITIIAIAIYSDYVSGLGIVDALSFVTMLVITFKIILGYIYTNKNMIKENKKLFLSTLVICVLILLGLCHFLL